MTSSLPSRRGLLCGGAALASLATLRGQARAALQREAQGAMGEAYDLETGLRYLNHASIGTMPRVVREVQRGYLEVCEGNPWLYIWGGGWMDPVEKARFDLASFLSASPSDLAITRNTTEAFNLLALGLELGPGDEVLYSTLNHTGASRAFELAQARRGYSVREFEFPVGEVRDMTPERVIELHVEAVRDTTRLVVLPHIDNQVGLCVPLAELARALRERGVRWVAVDGAQSVGMIPVDVEALDCDLYATSGHKWLQGPKGTGLLYAAKELREHLEPLHSTWGHDRWKGTARVYEDYGTRAVADVLALADAARFQSGLPDRAEHDHALREAIRAHVAGDERWTLLSPADDALASAVTTIGVEAESGQALAKALFEEYGFVVRPFELAEKQALRLSPNVANTTTEIEGFFAALGRLLG